MIDVASTDRPIIIYGIQDKNTGEVRYVGQAVSLMHRKATGYSGTPVGDWLDSIDWRYMELEQVPRHEAQHAEEWWIAWLKALGCQLLNKQRPRASSAYGPETPPLTDIGKASGVYRKSRLTVIVPDHISARLGRIAHKRRIGRADAIAQLIAECTDGALANDDE